jgi:hypothetical protein
MRLGAIATESSILVSPSVGFELGFAASGVARVVAESEWVGQPPVLLEKLFRYQPLTADVSRVLVIPTGQGDVGVKVTGRLFLRIVDLAQLCELPQLVRSPAAELILGVLFSEDQPPLLVVDPQYCASHDAQRPPTPR